MQLIRFLKKVTLVSGCIMSALVGAKNSLPPLGHEETVHRQEELTHLNCGVEDCFVVRVPEGELSIMLDKDMNDLPDLSLLSAMMRIPDDLGAVVQSPIDGLYQINIGNEIFYLSKDGNYLIEGNLLDLKARKNLTDEGRNYLRYKALSTFPDEVLEYYFAENPEHEVTIFIDSDCPYCRVVLNNIEAYNARNITLRIAPFPRSIRQMGNHYGLRSIWCAPNRKEALRQEARGNAPISYNCTLDLQSAYLAARDIGIYSVPSFVLADGTLISGYISPENLARTLNNERQ